MIPRGAFFCLLLIGSAVVSAAESGKESIRVTAEIDKALITIGERLHYQVIIRHDPAIRIVSPIRFPNPGDFEITGIRDIGPSQEGGQLIEGRVFEATSFVLGDYVIEGLRIRYENEKGEPKEIQTNRLYVTVESIDKSGKEKTDIRGIKGVVGLKADRRLLVALASILGLGTGVIFIWKHFRRREARAPFEEVALLPHEEAYQALRRLFDGSLIRQGKVKDYYDAMSDILRRYLEKRFDFPAFEETTSEIRTELKRGALIPSVQTLIQEVLELCDLAKFAKYLPEPTQIAAFNKRAIQVIDLTKPEPVAQLETPDQGGVAGKV